MNYLEQFEELRTKTPLIGLQCVQNENSPFCQYTEKSKDCYMTFASYTSQDCMYNHRVFYCTDCVDCALCWKCELCYQCTDCKNCYNCENCKDCEQATDCYWCFDCIGITNCFGCIGLRKGEYQIFNKQYTKEEYEKHLPQLKKMTSAQVGQHIGQLYQTVPRVYMRGRNNENVTGDYVNQSRNCVGVFDSESIEDCINSFHCDDAKDLVDCTHLGWAEQCYQIMSGGNLNECMFCTGCWFSSNLLYCDLVFNSTNCFLCVGVNHKKFHILNEEYSEEDYHKKKAEIIASMKADGTWGKWFKSPYPEVITYGA